MTFGRDQRSFTVDPIDFRMFAASGDFADVIFVTKENLHLWAHKERSWS